MADSTITYLVLAGAVILFVTNRVPIALVAIGVSVSLWATGVLDLGQSLAGFGDPTVIFIAALFVVADCLENTGVTAWMGQQLLDRAGSQRSRVLIGLMVTCAVLTAFVTPNASVAALLPAAVLAAMRTRQNSSQLLMPMAFAAHAGSMLALTGAPANVLVAEAAADADAGTFSFFSFAIVGVPLLIGTVVITVALGRRVLPHRNGRVMSRDFGSLARTLVRDYELDADDTVFGRRIGSVEVVLPPRTPLIGQRAFAGMVTDSGELVVVGVRRNGRSIGEREVVLRAGDSLLLRGTWEALDRQIDDEVLVVDDPGQVRRQIVPLGLGAKESLVVLAGMVALLVTGAVPPAIAAILAAGALVLLGVTDADQAFRSISWTTVVLVAGMIPLSTAMQSSGAARQMADRLVDLVGDAGPYALLVGLFVLVAVLGQLISNTATALIVIPVGVSAAAQIDVSPMPVLMCINIAAAAALLTPVATPANLMVMEPGGYRFGSYVRLGLPVMAWYALIAVVLTPLVWRF